MSPNTLPVQNIQFGVSLPPYQSKSAGAGFEDAIERLKQDLKMHELRNAMSLLTPSGTGFGGKSSLGGGMDFFPGAQLFGMDSGSSSLLGDLLLMAMEESRRASMQAAWEAETGEKSLESQIDARYKFDLSRVGGLLKNLL